MQKTKHGLQTRQENKPFPRIVQWATKIQGFAIINLHDRVFGHLESWILAQLHSRAGCLPAGFLPASHPRPSPEPTNEGKGHPAHTPRKIDKPLQEPHGFSCQSSHHKHGYFDCLEIFLSSIHWIWPVIKKLCLWRWGRGLGSGEGNKWHYLLTGQQTLIYATKR